MRLQVFSDLHLELGHFEPTITNADVVVLAGDIHQGIKGLNWAKQFCRDCPVIYVLGNHEFYNHSIPELINDLKRKAKGSNVRVLENDAFIINDLAFLGCSLWTNFHLWPDAREAMSLADREMSDFWLIKRKEGNGMFCANDSAQMHAASVRWLARQMSCHDPARTIVVTHHAPSSRSIPPHNVGDVLSAAFASDLDSMIQASHIPLWIHGHTHHNVDYKIGATRIYSNQRGYPNETALSFEPEKVIKI